MSKKVHLVTQRLTDFTLSTKTMEALRKLYGGDAKCVDEIATSKIEHLAIKGVKHDIRG